MPQQDFSKRIGKSTSPMIQRVITNNEGVQNVLPAKPQAAINEAFNKHAVPVKP